jgi:hypothetical protein
MRNSLRMAFHRCRSHHQATFGASGISFANIQSCPTYRSCPLKPDQSPRRRIPWQSLQECTSPRCFPRRHPRAQSSLFRLSRKNRCRSAFILATDSSIDFITAFWASMKAFELEDWSVAAPFICSIGRGRTGRLRSTCSAIWKPPRTQPTRVNRIADGAFRAGEKNLGNPCQFNCSMIDCEQVCAKIKHSKDARHVYEFTAISWGLFPTRN